MLLNTPTTPTSQFDWNKEQGRFEAEISSTNGFGRAYDDAIDLGMTLLSAKEGHSAKFVVEHTETDSDGDVWYWDLYPVNREYRFSIRVYND